MDSKAKILCVCIPFFIPFSDYFSLLLFLWLAVLASHWTAGGNGLRAYFLYITPDTDGLGTGLESHIWCFIKNQLFKIQPLMQLFIISNCQKKKKKTGLGSISVTEFFSVSYNVETWSSFFVNFQLM